MARLLGSGAIQARKRVLGVSWKRRGVRASPDVDMGTLTRSRPSPGAVKAREGGAMMSNVLCPPEDGDQRGFLAADASRPPRRTSEEEASATTSSHVDDVQVARPRGGQLARKEGLIR
jgi:hypothetical protein